MRRLALALGLLGLVLAFSITQPGSSQLGPAAQQTLDREQLQLEILILRLMNEMGLSRDQVATLKDIVSELRASQQAILQAQQELRDFLMGYQGGREGFAEAVKPFDDKLAQAQKAFQEKLHSSVDKVKDLITLKQAEILQKFLLDHFKAAAREAIYEHKGDFPCKIVIPEVQGELEFRLDLPQAPEELFDKLERLRGRIRGWLDHLGVESYPELSERLSCKREKMHMPPWIIWKWRCERPQRLQVLCEEFAPPALKPKPDLLERFLLRHLELLEKVLGERLQRMGTS